MSKPSIIRELGRNTYLKADDETWRRALNVAAWVSSITTGVLFIAIGYPEQVNGKDHVFSSLQRGLKRTRDSLFPRKKTQPAVALEPSSATSSSTATGPSSG